GYHQVTLSNKGNRSVVKVHRLVGLAWIPNPDNKKTINHIDGRKTNNHVDNLEWMTIQENLQHAFETGLKIYHMDKLLANKDKIEGMLLQGLSCRKIAKVYDCSDVTISNFIIENNLRGPNYTDRIDLTNDQVQEAYILLTEGKSLISIGKSLGVSYGTVRNRLNKFYGKSHIDEIILGSRITLTNNQVKEAYDLLSEGKSLNSIGKFLSVNHNTVRSYLNKLYGKSHIDEVISSSKLTIYQVQEAYNLL